jgi:iron-sulfur cluster assembly accessory protein
MRKGQWQPTDAVEGTVRKGYTIYVSRPICLGCIALEAHVSTMNQPEVMVEITAAAATEVMKFIDQEGVDPAKGGLRVSVQPGGCSGFKYGLLIEDEAAEDDLVVDQSGWRVFVDPFSAQYLNGVTIDYVTSMQGSGFTFKNPNSTGGCGCGSSFSA